MNWVAPVDLGSTPGSERYDTLRADGPATFNTAVCIESNDGTDTSAQDAQAPVVGTAFFYLVRAETPCAGGAGPLGAASYGTPRAGRTCR